MLEPVVDQIGTAATLALAGLVVGLIFGAGAQHSRFCLRAAVVEIAEARPGIRFSTWLVTFFAALVVTQLAILGEALDVTEARQLASVGSLSGAIAGGLMFGAGMILARGCASRLLVLSATGNLRALVTGLVLTLVAQSSLRGILATPRQYIAQLWTVDGGSSRNLLAAIGVTPAVATGAAGLCLLVVLALAIRNRYPATRTAGALAVGFAVAFGWIATYQIAQSSFDVVPVSSVTFTGPSTDTLMVLVNERQSPLNFGIGLVIGVFIGSAATAVVTGEWQLLRFGADTPMERYLAGAVLMGFGAMLAGGCAVGAGVSGSAVFALTAWTAIFFMWVGATATHLALARWPRPVAPGLGSGA